MGASSVLGSYRKLAARRAESGIVVRLKAGQRNKRLQVDAEFPEIMTGTVLERAAVSQELSLQGMVGEAGGHYNERAHGCAGTCSSGPCGSPCFHSF